MEVRQKERGEEIWNDVRSKVANEGTVALIRYRQGCTRGNDSGGRQGNRAEGGLDRVVVPPEATRGEKGLVRWVNQGPGMGSDQYGDRVRKGQRGGYRNLVGSRGKNLEQR